MSEDRSANKGKNNLPGAGLSNFSNWSNSTQFLWFMSLTLNALFTTIGVGVRDLSNTECKLNVTRTFGMVENRTTLYALAIVAYIILCGIVIVIQMVYDLYQVHCTEKEFTYQILSIREKCMFHCESVAGKKFFEHLLINTLTLLAAALYLAGDNYFLLVDLYNDDNSKDIQLEKRSEKLLECVVSW